MVRHNSTVVVHEPDAAPCVDAADHEMDTGQGL